jgi:glycosyltransferase involved in cell wall biosynthesis
MNKRRVLLVSEVNSLNSGFGTYANELLKRLHATNKYELAEFACYGKSDMSGSVPWAFYGNMPEDGDQQAIDFYNSNGSHQFGTWRFDKTCIDFKPDIVICYRDPWMDNWIQNAPTRPYFHWVWMPTVDSSPQRQEWIDTFSTCDAVLAYSEFGGKVLKEQGKERINYIGCASPGIDPEIYKPLPKEALRKEMGIDPECFIVGTVMRNQKRKLFFELMKSFRLFLDDAPSDVASKTFLYLHTSYPEKNGWDIADGIMQNGLGGKVLMTYVCRMCKQFFPAMFQDALTKCKFCNQRTAVCPTVSFGVSVESLAKIYNLFDIYVQYAICEGFGMPQVEAAACGVPVAGTDYSAMHDVIKFTQGYPVPVRTFFREIETNAERAYPDNEKLKETLIEFFGQSEEQRAKQSMEVRKHTIKRYNWNDTARIWERYIDSYEPNGSQGKWNAPPSLTVVPDNIPENLSNEDFIKWVFTEVLHNPDLLHQNEGVKLYRDLCFGAEMGQGVLEPISREKIFDAYKGRAHNKNQAEQLRVGRVQLAPEKFILEAHAGQEEKA